MAVGADWSDAAAVDRCVRNGHAANVLLSSALHLEMGNTEVAAADQPTWTSTLVTTRFRWNKTLITNA